MKNLFIRDPFDIAPGASRYTRASWIAMGAGLLFMALCAWALIASIGVMREADRLTEAKRRALRVQEQRQVALRLQEKDPAALAKIKAQQKLQQSLRTSWAGLFGALESAAEEVKGGVSVTSLAPAKGESDATQVGISALAISSRVMLDYMAALQENPQVRDVLLLAQQTAKNGADEVVRFKVSIVWDPSVPAPVKPVAAHGERRGR